MTNKILRSISMVFLLIILNSCQNVLYVDVNNLNNGNIIISVSARFKRNICINSIFIQQDGRSIWGLLRNKSSNICLNQIKYPVIPQGFKVIDGYHLLKPGSYRVSVISDDGLGDENLIVK